MRRTRVPYIIFSSWWAVVTCRASVTCLCLTWSSLHYSVLASWTCCLNNFITRELTIESTRAGKLNRRRCCRALMANETRSASCTCRHFREWILAISTNYEWITLTFVSSYAFLTFNRCFFWECTWWARSASILGANWEFTSVTWTHYIIFVLEASRNWATVGLPL